MLEKRIMFASIVFVLSVAGIIGLTVKLFGIGVPTCLTDVRPFSEAKLIEQAPNRYEIHYVARMWKFDPPEVAVMPGSTADIYVSSADVTHGLQIVGTNVNLEVVPGAVNYARVKFDKPGEYLVLCNEYCGVGHHNMAARIHVSKEAVDAAHAKAAAAVAEVSRGGKQLLDSYGCTACHSLDGSVTTGPTFKGLYGSKRVLANGTTVVADDAYLRESIEKPDAKVVKGFEAVMPPLPVTPADENAIIEFLKTLK